MLRLLQAHQHHVGYGIRCHCSVPDAIDYIHEPTSCLSLLLLTCAHDTNANEPITAKFSAGLHCTVVVTRAHAHFTPSAFDGMLHRGTHLLKRSDMPIVCCCRFCVRALLSESCPHCHPILQKEGNAVSDESLAFTDFSLSILSSSSPEKHADAPA